jgi:hypothetical protein
VVIREGNVDVPAAKNAFAQFAPGLVKVTLNLRRSFVTNVAARAVKLTVTRPTAVFGAMLVDPVPRDVVVAVAA